MARPKTTPEPEPEAPPAPTLEQFDPGLTDRITELEHCVDNLIAHTHGAGATVNPRRPV